MGPVVEAGSHKTLGRDNLGHVCEGVAVGTVLTAVLSPPWANGPTFRADLEATLQAASTGKYHEYWNIDRVSTGVALGSTTPPKGGCRGTKAQGSRRRPSSTYVACPPRWLS